MKEPHRGLLLGISVVWIPLAFLSDGLTVLVLPVRLGIAADPATLGLVTFVGLVIAVAMQPLAGWASDRLRGSVDRRVFLILWSVPVLGGLALLGRSPTVGLVIAGYFVVTCSGSAIQAALQALLPEHVRPSARGQASGLKTAFDIGGSFLAS